jgi:hypothetical protein
VKGLLLLSLIMLAAGLYHYLFIRPAQVDSVTLAGESALTRELAPDAIALERAKLDTEREKQETERLKEQQRQAAIRHEIATAPWWNTFWQISSIISMIVGLTGLVTMFAAFACATIRKASVHTATVNGAEIPIHQHDLHALAPAVLQMTQAEMIAAV